MPPEKVLKPGGNTRSTTPSVLNESKVYQTTIFGPTHNLASYLPLDPNLMAFPRLVPPPTIEINLSNRVAESGLALENQPFFIRTSVHTLEVQREAAKKGKDEDLEGYRARNARHVCFQGCQMLLNI